MLERLKNLKIVKTLNEQISPKLRWLNFMNRNKNNADYISMIMCALLVLLSFALTAINGGRYFNPFR